jgi:hypothetical protein
MVVTFWRLLDDSVSTTGFGRIRWARPFDRCRGLRPGEGKGHGWSDAGGGELQVLDDDVILRWFEPNQVVRELRQSKAERIGGEGEAAAHRRWRNRSGKLAGSADPDDELRWFEMIFARENKEGRGRNQRGFYRGPRCGEGVRVWRDSIGRLGGCRAPARLCQRKKESLTCGPRMSARGERGSDTLSGFACWVMGWI